ncbi:MAG TPA: amidohydrolase family protein [Mycobacteriales bacterium]|nr:amidohydrolase family protein [Mycobacteriales bacterium]
MRPDERYIIISADTHAGGSHAHYREYLDPKYRDDFDAWREKYRNPFKDLKDTDLRVRNWDGARRASDQNADGVVAEVLFPNTIPPFFPSFVLFAQPPRPEEYEHRHAGVQAHNRWLADYCAENPTTRAGIGQIFLNDVDDAIADARWCWENGLRGGVLIGSVPPTCDWIKPLYDPCYDPIWEACAELGIPVNAHSGTGGPVYQYAPAMPMVHLLEIPFYSQRPLAYLILGGVFERFPTLKFVLTEAGCEWIPGMLAHLDGLMAGVRSSAVGEMRFDGDTVPPKSATEYFRRNCYIGVSQPTPRDITIAIDKIGVDHVMWGSDYPHEEGTHPFTREHLRQVLGHLDPDVIQTFLAGTAADLYGFDLDALRPLADEHGPTVAEVAEPLRELPDGSNRALKIAARQLKAAG